jgi:hypothetical protein
MKEDDAELLDFLLNAKPEQITLSEQQYDRLVKILDSEHSLMKSYENYLQGKRLGSQEKPFQMISHAFNLPTFKKVRVFTNSRDGQDRT